VAPGRLGCCWRRIRAGCRERRGRLGLPGLVAALIAKVAALVAGTVVARIFHGRDERASALVSRCQVLEPLTMTSHRAATTGWGLSRADRCPVPFSGPQARTQEVADQRAHEIGMPGAAVRSPAG
jgi:hypothetical protein